MEVCSLVWGRLGSSGTQKLPCRLPTRNALLPIPSRSAAVVRRAASKARASLSGLIRRLGWALSDAGKAQIQADLAQKGQVIDPQVFAELARLYQANVKQGAYQVRTFADEREDAFCRWLLEDWAIMLGALFASVAPVLHPDLFIIGGGMTEISAAGRDWFLGVVRESYGRINSQSCFDSQPGNCEITWSVSRDQGWRGAILMEMRAIGTGE